MICEGCIEGADESRNDFDEGQVYYLAHPDNCGCPCQHRQPQQWEKQFSTPQPKDSDV